jgi:hypothetical protein
MPVPNARRMSRLSSSQLADLLLGHDAFDFLALALALAPDPVTVSPVRLDWKVGGDGIGVLLLWHIAALRPLQLE